MLDSPPMETLGARIRRARRARGHKTAKALALLLGVDPKTVRRWEADEFLISSDTLAVLAEKIGVTVDWLLTGRDAIGSVPPPAETALEQFLRTDGADRRITAEEQERLEEFATGIWSLHPGWTPTAEAFAYALEAWRAGAPAAPGARHAEVMSRKLGGVHRRTRGRNTP